MKLLIFGGTGRTGSHVVQQALSRGHQVIAVVRDPSKLPDHPLLTSVQSSPEQPLPNEEQYRGCQAVLSTLNISRASDFPWAPLITPKTFLHDSIRNIVHLMERYRINRILITSAHGVGDSRANCPFWFRWIINNSNVKFPYQGHEEQEQILKNTALQWTAIRPVGLTNGGHGEINISRTPMDKVRWTISRKDVAKFMLESIDKPSLYQRCLSIYN